MAQTVEQSLSRNDLGRGRGADSEMLDHVRGMIGGVVLTVAVFWLPILYIVVNYR